MNNIRRTCMNGVDVDHHVGQQIRKRRVELGLTQGQLADGLGLTWQQVTKYEKGTNRVSAGRLFAIGKVLTVSIAYFYEGLEEVGAEQPPISERERMVLMHTQCFRELDAENQNMVADLTRRLKVKQGRVTETVRRPPVAVA